MTTEKPNSRLAKHLQILSLEDGGFSEQDLKSERAGIASMKPPALNLDHVDQVSSALPGQRSGNTKVPFLGRWMGVAAIGMAALIAVMIYMPKDEPGYQVKGELQSTIYLESSGRVSVWDRKSPLENGTKLRVEFKAQEKMTGMVGVVDREFNDLFLPEDVWQKRVELEAGEVKSSAGSIELEGENEGETLLVLKCPVRSNPGDFTAFTELWMQVKNSVKMNQSVEVQGCWIESIALR